jgi:carbonic anhydrase
MMNPDHEQDHKQAHEQQDDLVAGYRRFRSEVWPAASALYEELATEGQRPATLVVACSDSRADPATVFSAGPGDLFVVRNIAGLVPPYRPDVNNHGTSAALEFGVRVLKVRRVVVLGHARCGGVRAMVEGVPEEARDFVGPWMAIAAPVLERKPAEINQEVLTHYEHQVVRLSLSNLMTFPWIAAAVNAGDLQLDGFSFDIHTGVLSRLVDGAFESVG